MKPTFTDDELRQIVTYIAVRYLEVERGLRHREALRPMMTPTAFRQLREAPPVARPAAGPVSQTDLGRLQLQRPTATRAFVALPARERGNEWSALVMQLRADREGVWRVTELARVNEHTISMPAATARSAPESRDVAVARANRDLQAARLALLATTEQHDRVARQLLDAAPRKPAEQLDVRDLVSISTSPVRWSLVDRVRRIRNGQVHVDTAAGDRLRFDPDTAVAVAPLATATQPDRFATLAKRLGDLTDQQRTWQRQVLLLETEHAALTRTAPRPQADTSRPPAYLVRTLGEPPRDPDARRAWDEAAGVVEVHRQRWNITTPDSPLGPPPADPYQAQDRDLVASTLRVLTERLRELSPPSADTGLRLDDQRDRSGLDLESAR